MSLQEKHCVPCEGGTSPFTEEKEDEYMNYVKEWELDRSEHVHKIRREYKFKDFKQAMKFVNQIADLAEEEQHHPVININYNRVLITLFTHAIKGLSENDFIIAANINNIKV